MSEAFQIEREWLVFFRRREVIWWFDYLLDPEYRHISAAAYYPTAERWLFVDPSAAATSLLVLEPGPHADALLGQWISEASGVLRVRSRRERSTCPAVGGCVASIKALLGIKAPGALSPRRLCRHLLANGAEIVVVPESENHERIVQRPAGSAAGRS